ncbi:hypothetical protein [Haloarcula amylovorans]|nr:hypothetical protein [Halomicroarcula amylolytica]
MAVHVKEGWTKHEDAEKDKEKSDTNRNQDVSYLKVGGEFL